MEKCMVVLQGYGIRYLTNDKKPFYDNINMVDSPVGSFRDSYEALESYWNRNGMFFIYQLVLDFATIHSVVVSQIKGNPQFPIGFNTRTVTINKSNSNRP